MECAFSPCPNDTFLFHAWVHGLIDGAPPIQPILKDIQELNRAAMERRYPICKVSFACLPHLLDDYALLPVGAALGRGCGPKIVARSPFPLSELSSKTIAIPGEQTTAHLLLSILAPEPREKHFCLYNEMLDQKVDAALIIHEQRFTFEREGFHEIADLGQLWEERYEVPIPLGGIVAKRSLDLDTITKTLSTSLKMAYQNPPTDYIMQHCQEPDVANQHIKLYVNEETAGLSPAGQRGVDILLREARRILC